MAFSSLYLPIYRPLSVSLCLSQSVIQSVTLSIFLSAYMYECLSVSHPSIHLPACLSLIHLSTCLFVCLSTIYPSKYLRLSILFFSFLSIHLHIPYILIYQPTVRSNANNPCTHLSAASFPSLPLARKFSCACVCGFGYTSDPPISCHLPAFTSRTRSARINLPYARD